MVEPTPRLYIGVGLLLVGGAILLLHLPHGNAPVSIGPNTKIRRHRVEDEGEAPVHHAVEPLLIYDEESKPEQEIDHHLEPRPLLEEGDYAEIYGPESTMTLIVRIVEAHVDGDKVSYSLIDGLTQVQMPTVKSEFVHAYNVYPAGTDAMCTVSKLRSQNSFTPCIILDAHGAEYSSRSLVYEVTYSDEAGKEVTTLLPPARVNRVLDENRLFASVKFAQGYDDRQSQA